MTFFNLSQLKIKQVLEGITVKSVSQDNTMLTFFEFEPFSIIPAHKHPNEQITYILEGKMEFTLEGNTKVLSAGEGVVIPSNIEHSAKVLDVQTKAIDTWNPVREDYKM